MNKPFTINNCTPLFLQGFTSGASPIAEYPGDPWTTTYKVFMGVWSWTLSNNGLVIEEPNCLN